MPIRPKWSGIEILLYYFQTYDNNNSSNIPVLFLPLYIKIVIDKNNKFTPVVSRSGRIKNKLIPTSQTKNIYKDYRILIKNISTGNSQRDHAVIFKRKKLCLSAFRYYHGIRGILWPVLFRTLFRFPSGWNLHSYLFVFIFRRSNNKLTILQLTNKLTETDRPLCLTD